MTTVLGFSSHKNWKYAHRLWNRIKTIVGTKVKQTILMNKRGLRGGGDVEDKLLVISCVVSFNRQLQ